MERMMRKASQYILRRGFAANFASEQRRVPRIDFRSIREANDAIRLFREMVAMSPQPSFLAYNKLLSVVAKMEEYSVALYMFDEMRHSRFPVDEFTMTIVINCCCHLNRVDLGFAVMGSFFKHSYQPDVTTFSALLGGLFLVGNVAEAEALFKKVLFFKLCQPNDVMILAMINGLCKSGQTLKARNLLWDFEKTGYKPNVKAYSALINGLCKDGMVDDALHLLLEMSNKGIQVNVVTYTTIIHGLCEDGRVDDALHLLLEMSNNGIQPNVVTYTTIIHGLCKGGRIDDALHLLFEMPGKLIWPNVVTYNTIIHGLCEDGRVDDVVHLLSEMPDKLIWPDVVTYNTIIRGLCEGGRVDDALHLLSEIQPDEVTYSTLIHGLCEDGRLDDALHLISEMRDKLIRPDVIAWNALIGGFMHLGKNREAIDLFQEMLSCGLKPDEYTFSSVLGSFIWVEGIQGGTQLHCLITKTGFQSFTYVSSALLDFYAKVNCLDESFKIFFEMDVHNTDSWNALIAGCITSGCYELAVRFIQNMLLEGFSPNIYTYSSILNICSDLPATEWGKQTHCCIIKPGLYSDVVVGTALVDMYAKCGRLNDARKVFNSLPRKNLVTWNAMIGGYAKHGFMTEALQIFDSMLRNGINPDDITFLAVLSSCAHVGDLEEALYHFGSMTKDFGITPGLNHLACLVTLYARKGETKAAYDLVRNFPCAPNEVVWKCLLSGCVMNKDLDLARLAAKEILSIDPNDASAYVMLSNVYVGLNMWGEASKVRELMKEKKVKKKRGCSWI